MKKSLSRSFLLIVVPFLFFVLLSRVSAYSETYPEYAGDYISCGGKWCPLKTYQLNTMMLQHWSGSGWEFISYAGFFQIPKEAIRLKDRKPRMLFYSGRQQADPRTVALVELGKLPYNNENVFDVDRENYNNTVRYRAENVHYQLWIFKRELPLRFKPVEGKTGMFIFEPEDPLPDGFYVIDTGLPRADGRHNNLSTAPGNFDFNKSNSVQTALPFVIGDAKEDVRSMDTSTGEASDYSNQRPSQDTSEGEAEDLGKSIGDAIFKALFK